VIVPGVEVDAAALAIPLEPLPADQVVAGTPSTGFVELTDTIGVWEHSPGTSTDVEADEVFVVLAGSATVSFTDSSLAPVELRPGSVVQLTAGMHTVWTVHETLRKVYVAG
jgi:uncharacterized cupin superfamily protein